MVLMISLVAMTVLSGCMFPQSSRVDNVPYEEQIRSVQTAVESFKETTGVLPIKTKSAETPLMERYPIEFGRLVPGYMADPPANSFEGGGLFLYVLVDVETEPAVKLIDLRVTERLQQLQTNINAFRAKEGKFPFDGSIGKNQFTLNYDLIFVAEAPTIPSPYTDNELPVYVDGSGQLFVDYREDIATKLENTDVTPEVGEDIRYLLYNDSPFAPAYSQGYTINEQGEVEFLNN
ncbi:MULTISPECIES: hypothetical protein [Exiguobacterium]|uniref:hypothetical protein n=1 Tax=Exiguobacterium TaxID=33986 RepID=UPI001BE7CF4C|nr:MULTISPECIES: hypothetical protein [Exiguobacterium]MCT4781800.1 hypothetical protein [Exiguobacterium himgiriensis]